MLNTSRTPFLSLLSLLSLLSPALLPAAHAADRQIITAPVTVGVGDTLRIAPGSEVLFAEYSGITVMGRLEAIGTKDNPIILASVNDTAGSATPFDWNGIEITGGGSAVLAYCHISGATSGITAETPQGLTLTACIFEHNGQYHVSIAGDPQNVEDGKPYSHTPPQIVIPEPVTQPAEPVTPPAVITTTTAESENSGTPPSRKLQWGIGGAGTAAAIGGVAALIRASTIKDDYNGYVAGNPAFDTATPEQRQKHFDKLDRQHKTATTTGWALIGLSAIAGVSLIFVF